MRSVIAFLVVCAASLAAAEDTCTPVGRVNVDSLGTPQVDFLRVAQLVGIAPPRPGLIERGGARTEPLCDAGLSPVPFFVRSQTVPEPEPQDREVRVLPVRLGTTWNFRYPSGDNDGLLWAGRGFSQLLSGGVAFRQGPFSAALAPEFTWSQNLHFQMVDNGRIGNLQYGNPFYGDQIDLPQRFGGGPFATAGYGQSYLRLDHWNLAVGLSTENLWLGPGVRNAILLSNAGPGFPHVFLGTSRPGDIWIGKAEALLFWGRLERSAYIQGGTHPLINGLVLTYEPRWVPGLYVGFARYFVQVWKDLTLRQWLSAFQTLDKQSLASTYAEGDNSNDNQIASFFARWVFPESGLEVYGEWAREDYNYSWWSEIREPDHAQAFTIGLQKVFRPAGRLVRVLLETTVLQEMAGFKSGRGLSTYYVHPNDLSLTNRGQLLGAWIGPGGSSQTLAVDVFHAGGKIGGFIERVRRNDGYYWEVVEPVEQNFLHDAEVAIGVRQVLSRGPVEISWQASAAYRQNRDFLHNEPNYKAVLEIALPFGRK